MTNDIQNAIIWLERLGKEGGKGVVNNVDARALRRVAKMLLDLTTTRHRPAAVCQKETTDV